MSKEKIVEIISGSSVSFMATIEGDKPRVRPMMIQVVWGNKIYFSTYRNSRKMSQLRANPFTEVSWMDKSMRQIRISGTAHECEDVALKTKYFQEHPALKTYFKGPQDINYVLMEITPEKVEWMDIGDKDYKIVQWN